MKPRNNNKTARRSAGALLLLLPLAVLAADKSAIAPKELRDSRLPNPARLLTLPGPAPANVTVTPITATNIQIQWSPAPNAIRYLISRNDAPDIVIEPNAGFLQNNRFGYTDVGRAPATLHTYSVTALYAAPALPGRSVPVQVLTPDPAPPQNLRAGLSGSNSVQLTWSALAGVSGYRVVRNGGSVPAVAWKVGGPSFVDQNVPPGHYTYIVSSFTVLANGQEFSGPYGNPVEVNARPFNIVALGDSIMWGQGLQPQNKFAEKVRAWLEGELHKKAALDLKAHSGAITYPNPGQSQYDSKSFDGEVPADWPTITRQIATAAQAPPNDVDLILLDGCINNIGVATILTDTDDGGLRDNTRAYCGAGMTNILHEVVQRFPNAKIVVTGYYPIISDKSNLGNLIPVFSHFGLILPPDPLGIGIAGTTIFWARSSARSDMFWRESTSSLQGAVNQLNGELANRPNPSPVRFASLNVDGSNSYAAPNSLVWLIPTPPLVQDEVYGNRKSKCDYMQSGGYGQPLPTNYVLCIEASLGHPSVAGAQAYTDAIKNVAGQFLPEWRAKHSGPWAAPDDRLTLTIQQSSADASGGTLVITATDGPGGPPLAGSVQFNNVAAGALGTPVRYTYQPNNPTPIVAKIDVNGRATRYFNIPVRTLAVAANVTNLADPRTAVVSVSDTLSGQQVNGTVMLNTTSGATNQPISYQSCGPFGAVFVSPPPPPVPCLGTVHVPYYPDVRFQDMPGTLETVAIKPLNPIMPARP
jgi:hypothetical protein